MPDTYRDSYHIFDDLTDTWSRGVEDDELSVVNNAEHAFRYAVSSVPRISRWQ